MRTFAVLPVKAFGHAKQRLGAALPPGARASLAEAMVADVLDALQAVSALDGIVVVTAERRAGVLAAEAGAVVVHDTRQAGQSAAAGLGIDQVLRRDGARAVLVPGDCPALDPLELSRLLVADAPVSIVPDRHGTGTNALVLTPPTAIAPAFGPGSLARHAALAEAAGHLSRIVDVPSLGLDVDTPDDLDALRAALVALPGDRAVRTRAALHALAAAAA